MPQGDEGQVWLAADKVPIFYHCYPGHKSDYYYAIIHGFAEHSGRYAKLIRCLQSTGRAVLTFDLRGHGRSGGARGAMRSWGQSWEDFRGLNTYLQEHAELPSCRAIILGHSLGGLITLEGAQRDDKDIGGLILSSPCLGLPLASGLILFNRLLARFFPDFSHPCPVKPEDLSRDGSVCQAYAKDPLILKSICAQTLHTIIEAADSLERSTLHFGMPVWFLAAGNERVVDLKRTLQVYAKLEAPFKKIKVFESFRHEIFNEVRNEIAYDTVLQAIEQVVEFNSKSARSNF